MQSIQISKLFAPAPRLLDLNESSPEFVAKYLQIKSHGVWEPLIVRPLGGLYEVVIGFDRYRCAQLLSNDTIPCLVEDCTDVEVRVLQFQESFMRRDDRPMLAKFLRLLIHELPEHYTLPDVAELVGQRTGTLMKILKPGFMADKLKEAVEKGHISVGKSIVLRRLRRKKQEDWLPRAQKMSEKQLRKLLQKEHLAHVKRPKPTELMRVGVRCTLQLRDLREIKRAMIDPMYMEPFVCYKITDKSLPLARGILRWIMSVDPETQKRRLDAAINLRVS